MRRSPGDPAWPARPSFDSSTGFALPSGARRSPDASWVARVRWDALRPDERERFPPLCPDFVVEFRSRTDEVDDLDAKMREYLEGGARLGWLLDPSARRVSVYRPGATVEQLDDPRCVSGDPELPGLLIELDRLWGARRGEP